MRLCEIISEDGNVSSFDSTLKDFRKFKKGADYTPSNDFGDEKISMSPSPKTSSARATAATTTKIPPIKPQINDKLRSIFGQMFKDFQVSAAEQNRTPLFSVYKSADPTKGTFGLSTKTGNNIKIGIGSGTNGEIKYYDIDEKDKDRREVMMDVLTNLGFKYLPTGSKFRFEVKNSNDLKTVFSDFWKMVNAVEELGTDFKSRRGSGTGVGSLITGKQAPWQYYMWIAKNIYNSSKDKASWGFSRGGGEGAYDRYDDILVIGITKGGAQQQSQEREAYREHVVPADLINRMGYEICESRPKTAKYRTQVIIEIAKMIHRNLAIVLTSSPPKDSSGKPIRDPKNPTDVEIIDQINGLQTTMPPGWKDGDDILARFTYCGIPVYKNKPGNSDSGKRVAEE